MTRYVRKNFRCDLCDLLGSFENNSKFVNAMPLRSIKLQIIQKKQA